MYSTDGIRRSTGIAALIVLCLQWSAPPVQAEGDAALLYLSEGNRLRRYDADTFDTAPRQDILIDRAADAGSGSAQHFRDVNGMVCRVPDGSGRFIAGEDTGQPNPPGGWGIFAADGEQVGKLTATYNIAVGEPFGCAFAPDGTLFTTSVGSRSFGANNGQLILWFPPFDGFPGPPGAYPATNDPSDNFCKIAVDIGTATGIAVDDQGRVYVSASSGLSILRFSPPFPTSPDAAGGCGATDAQGSPLADSVQRETFVAPIGLSAFSGLTFGPNGNLFAGAVLNGHIYEFDQTGQLVRIVVDPPEALPPISTGNPQGIAFGPDGTLYYADLDLVGSLPNVGPGPNGKLRRVRFDELGNPLAPEILVEGLAFPDGVTLLPGDFEPREWRTYAGGPQRRFFNETESTLTAENIDQLVKKWTFRTDAIVTGSPTIARVDVPGEGRIAVAYIESWDGNVYALRVRNGSELWRFATAFQPGARFPNAGSAHVESIDGREIVFIAGGETMYALDAIDGSEIWRFEAGTGCITPPGLCGFNGERNEIESSPIVAGGRVIFGMDVDDRDVGKGGIFAVDAIDGHLEWFFDLESGSTCVPSAVDDIRRFDPYHSEAELGLPVGFLASRPGCDFPRTPNGCGNVWSSAALDEQRGLLYTATSNCDTDSNPATSKPEPPMPPYDEAVVALDLDGFPVWHWRPREIDNDDLAFGGVPNLFSVVIGGVRRDVVGIGNKDGTYYLLDRDGVNGVNGVRWDDADPSTLPYWSTQVVAGGSAGGIIATAAVDEAAARIYFSTAPGSFSTVLNPQRPTVHALDAHDGTILWQNSAETTADASFAPTSASPGLVFIGGAASGFLRVYDAIDGSRLNAIRVGLVLASAPAVVDGLVVVGAGIGSRSDDPNDPGDITSRISQPVTGLCVPGTDACANDVPVAGRRLVLRDVRDRPDRRRLSFAMRDQALVPPELGSADDPTAVGLQVEVASTTRSESVRIDLPASGWTGTATNSGSARYRYADPDRAMGPCARAVFRDGLFRARCKGPGVDFTLDEPSQDGVVAALRIGQDILCARFGDARRDDGTADVPRAAFVAGASIPPPACPLP